MIILVCALLALAWFGWMALAALMIDSKLQKIVIALDRLNRKQ